MIIETATAEVVEQAIEATVELTKEAALSASESTIKGLYLLKETSGSFNNIAQNIKSSSLESLKAENEILSQSIRENREIIRLPVSNGTWEGNIGDSMWFPNKESVPLLHNPEEFTMGEILEESGVKGIRFNEGEPNFSEVAEYTVEINDFSSERSLNFSQADESLAEQWLLDKNRVVTAHEVKDYRKLNKFTWHECGDMKTMDLVKTRLHANIPHTGGVYAAKKAGL